MHRETVTCDECGSSYFEETSEMLELCAECSYVLFDYPACEHSMADGRCEKCGWDGSRSKHTAHLIQCHEMSDEELKSELCDLKLKMETLERYEDVIATANKLVKSPADIVSLYCEWWMEEYKNTDYGGVDLRVFLNREVVVLLKIPNNRNEKIEHSHPELLEDYLERGSSYMSRQIDLVLAN